MNEKLRSKALQLLSYRAHSRKELHDKLLRKGAENDEIEEVLDWLTDQGFLNDRDYAEMIVRKYRRKAYERWRIRAELFKRGIDREIREEVLSELPEDSVLLNPEEHDEAAF